MDTFDDTQPIEVIITDENNIYGNMYPASIDAYTDAFETLEIEGEDEAFEILCEAFERLSDEEKISIIVFLMKGNEFSDEELALINRFSSIVNEWLSIDETYAFIKENHSELISILYNEYSKK